MKLSVHASELSRMMKAISKCIDNRPPTNGAIEISTKDGHLIIRSVNTQFAVTTGCDADIYEDGAVVVDGKTFGGIISRCSGLCDIKADNKSFTVQNFGRTRLPVLDKEIPKLDPVTGEEVSVMASGLFRTYDRIGYAISHDETRIILTGALLESSSGILKMVSLDGFKLAVEQTECTGSDISAVVPGGLLRVICENASGDALVRIITDGKRIMFKSTGIVVAGGLLTGQYVDYGKVLPQAFKTEVVFDVNKMKTVLKSAKIATVKNNLVRLRITENLLTIATRSEAADFDAEMDCETSGDSVDIAFNDQYLMDTLNAINTEYAVMKLNSPTSPGIICGKDEGGVHLLLPVRTTA